MPNSCVKSYPMDGSLGQGEQFAAMTKTLHGGSRKIMRKNKKMTRSRKSMKGGSYFTPYADYKTDFDQMLPTEIRELSGVAPLDAKFAELPAVERAAGVMAGGAVTPHVLAGTTPIPGTPGIPPFGGRRNLRGGMPGMPNMPPGMPNMPPTMSSGMPNMPSGMPNMPPTMSSGMPNMPASGGGKRSDRKRSTKRSTKRSRKTSRCARKTGGKRSDRKRSTKRSTKSRCARKTGGKRSRKTSRRASMRGGSAPIDQSSMLLTTAAEELDARLNPQWYTENTVIPNFRGPIPVPGGTVAAPLAPSPPIAKVGGRRRK